MATIDVKIEGSLLTMSVNGDLAAEEVIAAVKEFYPNGMVKDVIWEFTNGSMQSISRQGFDAIAKATKETLASGVRHGGKTVFVGNAAVEYGLLRMYTAIAELTGVSILYNVFKTIEEARSWIEHDQPTA